MPGMTVNVLPRAAGYSLGLAGGNAYQAALRGSQELGTWNARLASADAEVGPARDAVVARARDLDRNNGWARGGIDRRVDAVIGSNLWLQAMPDYFAMGMGQEGAEWAAEWARTTEAKFRTWANSTRFLCDVERHLQFGGLVRLAYQHYLTDGEACAALYWLDRGGVFSTSVLVLDPDRLSNPDGTPDSERLRGGVETDRYGAAVAYHVRNGHPNDVTAEAARPTWTRIPRETAGGRALFVHVFDKRRAHMRRGITRLASVITRLRQLDGYDRTEIQAAITNATFGLYAKTERSSAEMRAIMEAPAGDEMDLDLEGARTAFYEESDLRFNGVRVAIVPAGDSIETIDANRPATHFSEFQGAVLRSIAGALGISYEQLSQDWSEINYSSARTLLNEIWRGLSAERHLFTQSFCTPIYAAWLEEAVARGLVEVPGGVVGFALFRDAITRCRWIGPGKGWVDPKKEAEAAILRMNANMTSLQDEAAEQGTDWEDNLWDAKRVQERREAFGLIAPPDPAPDAEDRDEPERREESNEDDEDEREMMQAMTAAFRAKALALNPNEG